MKLFYLFIPAVFILFIGCSTTYKATEYMNKKEFYKDFNSSVLNNKLKVTLNNDSLFVVPEGAEIKSDSIFVKYFPDYYPLKLKLTKDKSYALAEVKQVSYTSHFKGIGPGIYFGFTIGGIVGATGLIFNYKTDGNHPENNYGADAFMGCLSGIVVGTIVGLIVGWDEIYQFNP